VVQLSDHIGQEILIYIPFLGQTFQKVKLHGAEPGGIWIENQQIANVVLGVSGVSGIPKAIVLFFPYSQIRFAMAFVPGVSLNEKAFDV
jgi:hypothetical protein